MFGELFPMKAHYFLFNAATAPVIPFIPLIARNLGYSVELVGFMYAILPIVGLFAKPIVGAFADAYRRHKLVFLLSQAVTLVAFCCIWAIPKVPADGMLFCQENNIKVAFCNAHKQAPDTCTTDKLSNTNTTQTFKCKMTCKTGTGWQEEECKNWNVTGVTTSEICDMSRTHLDLSITVNLGQGQIYYSSNDSCYYMTADHATLDGKSLDWYCPALEDDHTQNVSSWTKMNCSATCDSDFVMELISTTDEKDVSRSYNFVIFFVLLALSWAGMAIVVSIADAICFTVITNHKTTFGHQRVWGSIGWGSVGLVASFLIDYLSTDPNSKNYKIGFYIMGIFIVLDLFASYRLNYRQVHEPTFRWRELLQLFGSFRAVVFFLWCIVSGLFCAMIWNFLYWYLEDLTIENSCDDAFSKTLQGLVMFIQCIVGEVPMFFLSGKVIKAIGHVQTMSLILFAYGVRFFCYSLLSNPWWVLPIEILNGITVGLFYSAMATYANMIAPPGTEATIQGFVQAIFEGIGVSIGSYVGGKMIAEFRGAQTFRYFSYAAFFCCLLHVFVQFLITKCSSPYARENYKIVSEDGNAMELSSKLSNEVNSNDRKFQLIGEPNNYDFMEASSSNAQSQISIQKITAT